MSGFFDDEPPARPTRPHTQPPGPNRSRALVATIAVLLVGSVLASAFAGIWTDKLWFSSLGYGSVFGKLLLTKVLLFVVFALLLGAVVAVNVFLAYRMRPLFAMLTPDQAGLERYRELIEPGRRWVLVAAAVALGLVGGASASGEWRNYLMWRNGQEFGKADPYFGKDIGFYIFDLPWLHFLVNFAMAAAVVGLIAAVVVHYLYGGIRLSVPGDKLTGAAHAQTSVLLGVFLLFKAFDYYLDRFDLTTQTHALSRLPLTGLTYTSEHAVLPSKNILMFIALICALVLFANVVRRTWLLPATGLALLALSAVLLGMVWPGVVQQFQVDPSEPDKEEPYIARNIAATRSAYGIDGVVTTAYPARVSVDKQQLSQDAQSIPGIRLLDPSLVSEAFQQLQQVKGYYSVPSVLDVDRYPINGQQRDVVIAARELNQSGVPDDQRNWANLHTVYTHGYGVIAAYGNQRNAQGVPASPKREEPVWAEEDLPPRGKLSQLPPSRYLRGIYFGEDSPDYSIVGKEKGGKDVELNVPDASSGGPSEYSTYAGRDGVGVGGLFHKLLYAIKFGEPNIVLSSRVNPGSKILYNRHPVDRVQAVAPWLTVDNDPYPAVVDGRVKWILDGYTTSDRYPLSEKRSLSSMTSDSLNPQAAYATLPTDNINYMRNAVKAVVDAYDGTVTLYEWDKTDPVLKAWEGAFPGIVQPRGDIPPDLEEHMRYPEDLFKVQRYLLAAYHVKDASTFYEGTDRWDVPIDPESSRTGTLQPPYRLSVRTPSGPDEPVFSLTSVYVPTNRSNLASFISVDADASLPDYGTIRILRLPGDTQVSGPSQIANLFSNDQKIQRALLPYSRGGADVLSGNLLTLPVGGGLLYVQPIYTQRQDSTGSYPVLRFVLTSFGKDVGYGTTLTAALNDVLGLSSGQGIGGTSGGSGGNGGQAPSDDVASLLAQAERKFADAQRALDDGDLGTYQQRVEEAQALVQRAIELARSEEGAASGPGGSGSGKAGSGGGGAASESPSAAGAPSEGASTAGG